MQSCKHLLKWFFTDVELGFLSKKKPHFIGVPGWGLYKNQPLCWMWKFCCDFNTFSASHWKFRKSKMINDTSIIRWLSFLWTPEMAIEHAKANHFNAYSANHLHFTKARIVIAMRREKHWMKSVLSAHTKPHTISKTHFRRCDRFRVVHFCNSICA